MVPSSTKPFGIERASMDGLVCCLDVVRCDKPTVAKSFPAARPGKTAFRMVSDPNWIKCRRADSRWLKMKAVVKQERATCSYRSKSSTPASPCPPYCSGMLHRSASIERRHCHDSDGHARIRSADSASSDKRSIGFDPLEM